MTITSAYTENRTVSLLGSAVQGQLRTPNPDDPMLVEYATGAQLAGRDPEERRKNPANIRRVMVISLKGDQAVVQECFVDDGLVVRRDTARGSRLIGKPWLLLSRSTMRSGRHRPES